MMHGITACSETQVNEGVLSEQIATSLQAMTPLLDEGIESKSLSVIHQLTVPDKSWSVHDVAIKHTKQRTVDAALEVKWRREEDKFPESQVSSYAHLLCKSGANHRQWLPVFVLSKTHYQLGVAFGAIGNRWAYSEIYNFSRIFSPDYADDILHILRFARTFLRAAVYHHTYPDEEVAHLVDKNGQVLITTPSVLGSRVLEGDSPDNRRMVLKLYANRHSAEQALAKHVNISEILKYTMNAELKEGCGSDGMCAIMDVYNTPTSYVTFDHLIDLVRQVKTLHESHYVHGDLRLPNIVFCSNGTTLLIDFDWSGKFKTIFFPAHVRKASFGKLAQRFITAKCPMASRFDWVCLADIFLSLGFRQAAKAAALGEADRTCYELELERQINDRAGSGLNALLYPNEDDLFLPPLDLGQLGVSYYMKRQKAKKAVDGASLASFAADRRIVRKRDSNRRRATGSTKRRKRC